MYEDDYAIGIPKVRFKKGRRYGAEDEHLPEWQALVLDYKPGYRQVSIRLFWKGEDRGVREMMTVDRMTGFNWDYDRLLVNTVLTFDSRKVIAK